MTSANHAGQIRERKMAAALACGIDDAFISHLVESFYEAVRDDRMLGPIFENHIDNWPQHLGRMKNFWASIMLESGRYSGSPMGKHIAIGGLDTQHFARWQTLWNQTLTRLAPGSAAADRFRDSAQRIGDSLLTGIQIDRGGLPAISPRAAS